MNRYLTTIAIAIAAAYAGPSFADDITIETTPFVSTKSRAEVQADLQQYRAAGVDPSSDSYDPLKTFRSTLTRQQVTAGFLASRDEVEAFTSEDSGSEYLSERGGLKAAPTVAGRPANNAQ